MMRACGPAPMFNIYGKHATQSRFRPMDLRKGKRVVNLIYATLLSAEQKERFFAVRAKNNPEWQFKARPVRVRWKASS